MLNKLQAVASRYEELCAKSEQPDFYADPQKAAKLLREKNELEPVVDCYRDYCAAEQEMADALELMAKYNTFADRQRFTNMILSSNTLYFTALATCFEQHIENEEVKNVVRALLDVQRFHEIYLVKQGDVSQATFMQGVELMKTMYESLSDQGLFADFQAYYDYYLAVYEQIQAED